MPFASTKRTKGRKRTTGSVYGGDLFQSKSRDCLARAGNRNTDRALEVIRAAAEEEQKCGP